MTDTYIEALERIADKLSDIYTALTVTGIIVCASMIVLVAYVIIKWGID